MCPEIAVSCNLLVAHTRYYSGTLTPVNRYPEEPQCSKIKNGKHGHVTLDGQSKASTPNSKMVPSSMQLIAPTLPSTKTHNTLMTKTFTYLPLEMIMAKLPSTTTLLWLKIPSISREEDTPVMSQQLGGPKMTNTLHQLEEKISVL